jgi:hypothetical protein
MTKNKSARASAIVRAQHGGSPLHLTKQENVLLNEAIRLGEDMSEEVESHVMRYGRWLLEAIFKNDAASALDDKSQNPVWLELVRRAGGPTLRVSRNLLYTSLGLAARDKRITDQSWQNLDAGRKELLLPLKDDRKIREAAAHVSKFNLTQVKTREYVSAVLASNNKSRQVRLTPPILVGKVRGLRETLGKAAVMRRVEDFHEQLDASERSTMADELDALREVLTKLSRTLRRR